LYPNNTEKKLGSVRKMGHQDDGEAREEEEARKSFSRMTAMNRTGRMRERENKRAKNL